MSEEGPGNRKSKGVALGRRNLVAGSMGAATALGASTALAGHSLFVFAVHSRRAHALEKDISAALSGVNVTVFGRISDFVRAVENERPSAVLAPEPVFSIIDYSPTLRGTFGGKTWEQYAIISQRGLSSRGAESVGAVDLLGRRKMPELVRQLLSSESTPRVIRVTRPEDLLPALAFNKAEAIVLPERLVGALKQRTSMELTTSAPAHARLGCLCVGGAISDKLAPGLRGLPARLEADLGVDGWR